jgi:N-methylhydantoinase B
LISQAPGGGGYGDPLDRDPERVAWDVREGWISIDRARSIYGVVLEVGGEIFCVDLQRTEELRREIRQRKPVALQLETSI